MVGEVGAAWGVGGVSIVRVTERRGEPYIV